MIQGQHAIMINLIILIFTFQILMIYQVVDFVFPHVRK